MRANLLVCYCLVPEACCTQLQILAHCCEVVTKFNIEQVQGLLRGELGVEASEELDNPGDDKPWMVSKWISSKERVYNHRGNKNILICCHPMFLKAGND